MQNPKRTIPPRPNTATTMNHHSAVKPEVSDDEAMAVLALTHLDRGTSAGNNNGKDFEKKPPAPKSSASASATQHAATTTTTPRKSPTSTAVRRTTGKSKQRVPNAVPIQTIPKRGNYVNHSYVDYSADPNDQNYRLPASLEDMTFAEKLHVVLSTVEYQNCISWLSHGRAFRVNVPVFFEKTVCPEFFGHKRFSSFLRQLNNHGFKHLTSGSSRNGYYHECFLRGVQHVVQYMPRAKDARRQVPDPDNEPDFDEISQRFPVPEVTPRATLQQDGATASISGDEAKIRGILQDEAKREEQLIKPKARTFDTMTAGDWKDGSTTMMMMTNLDQPPPAVKKPALLLPQFASMPAVLLPPASAYAGLPNCNNNMGGGGLPTNLWAQTVRNQQVMEQLQLQQQLQQMLSRMQQDDAAEQLLRSLYNNPR